MSELNGYLGKLCLKYALFLLELFHGFVLSARSQSLFGLNSSIDLLHDELVHREETVSSLKHDPFGHSQFNDRHEEKVQASASEGFLDPNCALLSLEDVVKDHAPSTAPSELLLDPNHNFEELASITLKFLLPLSFLDVLVDGKLDNGPCSTF